MVELLASLAPIDQHKQGVEEGNKGKRNNEVIGVVGGGVKDGIMREKERVERER